MLELFGSYKYFMVFPPLNTYTTSGMGFLYVLFIGSYLNDPLFPKKDKNINKAKGKKVVVFYVLLTEKLLLLS